MQKLVWKNSIGDEIDLTGGNYGITEWEGFANTSLNIQSQQVPFQDGSVFLDALMEQRELSVTLKMQDNGNLEERYRMRRELIHSLNPKLGEGYLIYTNDFISKRIKCVAQIPLFETHNSNDSGTPKASLAWTACEPYWEDLEETEVAFGIEDAILITNEGDIPSQLDIEFLTNYVENPTIIRENGDKRISIDTTANNNVYINTNFGKKEVYAKNLTTKINQQFSEFLDVCYSLNLALFVGIKASSTISMSYDGITWNDVKNGVNAQNLRKICYSEELKLFVAIGADGEIISSSDGINWNIRKEANTGYIFSSIIYSEEKHIFITVGNTSATSNRKPVIFTSADGITWTGRLSSEEDTGSLGAVAYSDDIDLFVAIGGRLYTSSDGITWTRQYIVQPYGINCLTYGDGLFIAGRSQGDVITSSDGINWEAQSGLSGNIGGICYVGLLHLFIAISTMGMIYTSSDGINWTQYSEYQNYILYSVCYSSALKKILIAGNTIITSKDGVNWSIWLDKESVVIYLNNIIRINELGLYVAVGRFAQIITSPDGITWTIRNRESTNKVFFNITYCNELNLLIGGAGRSLYKSSNSIDWNVQDNIIDSAYGDITYINFINELHLFIMVTTRGAIFTSQDGTNWTFRYSANNSTLKSIVYNSELNLIVIVGYKDTLNYGLILTSTDGTDWNETILEEVAMLQCAYYSKEVNLFVTGGYNGVLYTSSDCINWSKASTNISDNIYGITYSKRNHLFLLSCGNGVLLISSDGGVWSKENIGLNLFLGGATNIPSDDGFLVVGQSGLVLLVTYTKVENMIQDITSNSDMELNLLLGDNKFRLTKKAGEFTCRIKYRQKYIGV